MAKKERMEKQLILHPVMYENQLNNGKKNKWIKKTLFIRRRAPVSHAFRERDFECHFLPSLRAWLWSYLPRSTGRLPKIAPPEADKKVLPETLSYFSFRPDPGSPFIFELGIGTEPLIPVALL